RGVRSCSVGLVVASALSARGRRSGTRARRRYPMSRAMRPPVRTHLDSDDQDRLDREASARGVSASQCLRDGLREYFALRAEVATALDGPGPTNGGDGAPTGLIHTLFARTEGR